MQQLSKFFTTLSLASALTAPAAALNLPSQGLAEPGTPASSMPGILGKIRIDQRIGETIPLDLIFTDDTGRQVRLGEFFGTRPVILALVYYECPMLCTQVLNGLVSALGVMNFEAGREFEVVAVSFNPKEGPGLAAQKKANYLERYGRPHTAAGWHFLTGSAESIARLTEAVGFRYEYDEKIGQFAHGAGIEVLTPKGTLSKYFYGIEFSARDIRLGVIEASEHRIGTAIDDVLLFCYHYDPATGKYGATVLGLVRLGGIVTVLAFLWFLTISLRGERQTSCAETDIHGIGPSGGALWPLDGSAHSAPATGVPTMRDVHRGVERERSGAWGPSERPSRPASAKATAARRSASREGGGSGRSPD